MCTLSIYAPTKNKSCLITMNRDELRSRPEAGVFNVQHPEQYNGLIFPLDQQSKGTWIGANDKGVVLCLLNHYQGQQQPQLASRGGIIPLALAQGKLEQVAFFLTNLMVKQYQPFDLFLVTQNKKLHFQWNGQFYNNQELSFKPWYMFTSSSYRTDEVLAYRQSLFKSWTEEVGKNNTQAEEIIYGFHLISTPSFETHSVLMARAHSHTKSIVQVDLSRQNLKLDYYLIENESALRPALSQSMAISNN